MTGLVKGVDKAIQKGKNSRGVFILMDKTDKANAEKLKALAEKEKIKMPLSLNANGKKAPGKYKINPKVKFTVLVYKKKKVVKNFAFNEISKADIKSVVEAVASNAKG